MSVKVNYASVEERDMDTLFLEAFGSDEGFLKLFINKIDELNVCDNPQVLDIQLSKTDSDGESDITVIFHSVDKKIGFLIEDKINAVAMDEQCNRYTKRGNKGLKNKDYDEFYVFIVAPKKYYEQNEEAKKYEHYVSYEECKEYFDSQKTVLAGIWSQQIDQAIIKGKKQSNVTPNPARMNFLREYIEYQKRNYEKLIIANDPDVGQAGGWVRLRVKIPNACIYHKAEKGFMDLTFFGGENKSSLFNNMVEKIHKFGFDKVACVSTGKSIAYRLYVPVIDFEKSFKEYRNKPELDACFKAAEQLTELADLISDFGEMCNTD